MNVNAVIDDALSPGFSLGDSLEVLIRRECAERFVEKVRPDDPARSRSPDREARAGMQEG